MNRRTRSTASSSRPRVLCTRSRRAHIITDETVVKSITGAKTGIRAPWAATNGAAATIPVGPMTADPTPVRLEFPILFMTATINPTPLSGLIMSPALS